MGAWLLLICVGGWTDCRATFGLTELQCRSQLMLPIKGEVWCTGPDGRLYDKNRLPGGPLLTEQKE